MTIGIGRTHVGHLWQGLHELELPFIALSCYQRVGHEPVVKLQLPIWNYLIVASRAVKLAFCGAQSVSTILVLEPVKDMGTMDDF